MKITGELIKKFDSEKISDKFTKRIFVLRTLEQYPQEIAIQLNNDRCSLIDSIRQGEQVEANVNLRGREYNGKWFNTIECWSLNIQTADKERIEELKVESNNQDLPF
jgi:single-strand DNA-binding protein